MKTEAVEQWDLYEITLPGPSEGNPFREVELAALFRRAGRELLVDGFYDGDGVYRIRFMPDEVGEWTYVTRSNVPQLAGMQGRVVCTPPSTGNHGPVRVAKRYHFAYADGTPYIPFGTTCYAWVHQTDSLVEQTLETLAQSPFNKLRMCVFPKSYVFNENEPPLYPFEGCPLTDWQFDRFNPVFFRRIEACLYRLRDLAIEADLILLHPYDRWGFAQMTAEEDDRYLRYVVARLAAFRNVWWSMANEFDFMEGKNDEDWDRMFRVVQDADPYDHLRSIHNGARFYDHSAPWVSHCSVQSGNMEAGKMWRQNYGKPVVFDEVCYEGNIEDPWGNITPQELVHRFWRGTVAGCYVGHGETYLHPHDILWWSKGGELHGESPSRIAFLRQVLGELPHGLTPAEGNWRWQDRAAMVEGRCYLFYFGPHQPSFWTLPEGGPWHVELLDTYQMTRGVLVRHAEGGARIRMPAKPWQALVVTRR